MSRRDGDVTGHPVASPSHARHHRRRWWIAGLVVVAVLIILRGVFFETFTVPSGSMEPTLRPGDRIVVWKLGEQHLHRGEIIVFNATDAFALSSGPPPGGITGALRSLGDDLGIRTGQTDYVKRVIGLPGDTLSVGHDGVLRINGHVAREPYLPPGMKASTTPFHVKVPPGHVFVMGDNRPASDDSRSHLGSPGGGTVPFDDVIGQVVWRYWPTGSWGRVSS